MGKPTKHYGGWRIRWIDARGKRRSEVYEKHDDAAFKLAMHEAEAERIRRGFLQLVLADHTGDEAFDYWMKNRAVHKRSGDDDESIIRTHLRPAFGALKLREIGAEQIDAYVAARTHLAKRTIRNQLALLSAVLNVAVAIGWLAQRPLIRKPRVSLFTADFHYLRSDEEIRRFLDAARMQGDPVLTLYATAVYTGLRKGELAALEWGDVDFDRRLITVQRSFHGPTKAEDVRYVPILDPILPVLERWRLRRPGLLVFPNACGAVFDESARVFKEVLYEVLDAAQFPKVTEGKRTRRYIVFHDLRHTFASQWVMKGGDLFKLQKILGHKSVQMTMRYAHLAPEAFAADYSRLGRHSPVELAAVIPLDGRRAPAKLKAKA